jgi:uncharacterized OB-fold protein
MSGPAIRPPISPSPEAAPFWAAAARHEFVLPYCVPCDRHFFYPRVLCPACGSRAVEWRPASGRGTLYTFCIQYRSRLPGYADAGPFVTAIVDLDEGPRLMSLLVGVPAEPAAIRCGIPVEVTFVDYDDGQALPVFRPAE